MRHAVVFFVLVAIVTIGVGELDISGANSAHAQNAAAQTASSPPPRADPGSVLNVPPEKMRDALSDIYRLTPDRRSCQRRSLFRSRGVFERPIRSAPL
jgi:hypothetical protein